MNLAPYCQLAAVEPSIVQVPSRVVIWDQGCLGDAAPEVNVFDGMRWEADGRLIRRAAGRGEASFIEAAGGAQWVLRHYQRGGLIAHGNHDRYLWVGAMHTRPVREFRLLDALYRRGLPVPHPIAAQAVRCGALSYRADLITAAITASGTLADRLAGGPLAEAGWRKLGGVIAALHRAGVWHADLNARNVLVDACGRFYLIDFDRARFRGDGAWRAANLKRFRRSLDKFAARWATFHFVEADWRVLLAGYRAGFGRL